MRRQVQDRARMPDEGVPSTDLLGKFNTEASICGCGMCTFTLSGEAEVTEVAFTQSHGSGSQTSGTRLDGPRSCQVASMELAGQSSGIVTGPHTKGYVCADRSGSECTYSR